MSLILVSYLVSLHSGTLQLPIGQKNDMDIPAEQGFLIKPIYMIVYNTRGTRGILLAFIAMTFFAGTKGFCTSCCSSSAFDCQFLLDVGHVTSGVYTVAPKGTRFGYEVYCDMETDGGGWLVFQRRLDGSVDFYKGWADYEGGFGDLEKEFWLGLVPLMEILSQGRYELRIDLEDWEGEKRFAKYRNFDIGNTHENYRLTASVYSGNAGDALKRHNGIMFSTKDKDNDFWANGSCSEFHKGGWWYKACQHANLNGVYHTSYSSAKRDGLLWFDWKGYNYSLKSTEMKIKMV